MSTLTLPPFPEGAVAQYLNGKLVARRCQCSTDCPKVVSARRRYAYGHSPAHAIKVAKQFGQPTARGVSYEDTANTTSLDYEMAKRRAQVESIGMEKWIDSIDLLIEQARAEVTRLQTQKDTLVHRHEHLQALIECADVLAGGPACSSAAS